jgi:hypothetical protein
MVEGESGPIIVLLSLRERVFISRSEMTTLCGVFQA